MLVTHKHFGQVLSRRCTGQGGKCSNGQDHRQVRSDEEKAEAKVYNITFARRLAGALAEVLQEGALLEAHQELHSGPHTMLSSRS